MKSYCPEKAVAERSFSYKIWSGGGMVAIGRRGLVLLHYPKAREYRFESCPDYKQIKTNKNESDS